MLMEELYEEAGIALSSFYERNPKSITSGVDLYMFAEDVIPTELEDLLELCKEVPELMTAHHLGCIHPGTTSAESLVRCCLSEFLFEYLEDLEGEIREQMSAYEG